ncbi:hypothetical protein BDF19DRAFT_456808, partial [Syncephalis fuscata]
SEYWKSQGRYFCNYCKIYVAENAISRKHHEDGRKHKGNVERFLRDVHTRTRKEKEDAEYMAREMAKIDQAAHAKYNLDLGRGSVVHGSDVAIATMGAPSPSVVSKSKASLSTAKVETSSRARDRTAAATTQVQAQMPFDYQKVNNRSQPVVGSSVANDALLEDEEEEKAQIEINPDDPDDLRNFKVVEKTHPTEFDAKEDINYRNTGLTSTFSTKVKKEEEDEEGSSGGGSLFKKRKAPNLTTNRSRNIRRK